MDNNLDPITEEIGLLAASLSLIEIGLGSILHAFKIPLAGHVLALNQMAILTRASMQISLIASLLKSLSPAGKKLTPMLAIMAQGLLYSCGVGILGLNYLGLFLAVTLASLWGFIQPLLFIYLLFGETSLKVVKHFSEEFEKIIPHVEQILLWVIIVAVILKILLGFFISILAIKISDKKFKEYQDRMFVEATLKKIKPVGNQSPYILAIKDLANPLFIISFIVTLIFFIFSNASMAQTIWGLIRPLALGFIFFYIIRVYPMDNLINFFQKKGFRKFAMSFEKAVSVVKNYRRNS